MEPISAERVQTAIPPRFASQRERVLRILARWEQATLAGARRLAPTDRLPVARPR